MSSQVPPGPSMSFEQLIEQIDALQKVLLVKMEENKVLMTLHQQMLNEFKEKTSKEMQEPPTKRSKICIDIAYTQTQVDTEVENDQVVTQIQEFGNSLETPDQVQDAQIQEIGEEKSSGDSIESWSQDAQSLNF